MGIHPIHATRFLRMQPWFAQLAPALQERTLQSCTVQRVRKGEIALRAHEAAHGWHAVLTGFVKLQAPATAK